MRWKLDVHLRTLILLVLIPCLLVATGIFGWLVYAELYADILLGFDQKLRAISTVTGSFVTGQDHDRVLLRHHLTSLVFDPKSSHLFGFDTTTRAIVRIDDSTGTAWRLGPQAVAEARAAVARAATNPFSIDSAGRLVRRDPPAAPRIIGPIVLAAAPDSVRAGSPAQRPGEAIGVSVLAFDVNRRTLYGSADGLVRIDTATAIATRDDFPLGFRNEQSPDYQKYAIPIRRIMRKKNITYLYTQLLTMGGRIVYGFDGSEGDQHSPLGAEDQLPLEELQGTERVLTEGTVHLSAIRRWQQWGLLKSAFAPVYWPGGAIKGMAGADVNISVISQKTRVALAEVGVIGAIILLLSAVVSFRIARKLVEPLADVKRGALRVTAGEYGFQLKSQTLDELAQLAEEFNRMSVTMQSTLEELTETNRGLEGTRRRRELERALAAPAGVPSRESGLRVTRAGAGTITDASDCISLPYDPDRAVVWMCDAAEAPMSALRLRAEIKALATRLLRQGMEWRDVAERLLHVYDGEVYAVVLLDATNGLIESRGRRPVPATIMGRDKPREIDVASMMIKLASGERLVLDSSGAVTGRDDDAPAASGRESLVVTFSGRAGASRGSQVA